MTVNKVLQKVVLRGRPDERQWFTRVWYKLMQYCACQGKERMVGCLEAFVKYHVAAGL